MIIAPFIILALLVIGALTATALNWDTVKSHFKGKRLAILGARSVGKTHMIQFLSKGSIPEKYTPTEGVLKASGRRLELKELDLKLDEIPDVEGSDDAYPEWKKITDAAQYIFYLLRTDKVISDDKSYIRRAIQDLEMISEWIQNRKIPFFIVGTFCDKDINFANRNEKVDENNVYIDRFRKNPNVVELVLAAGGSENVKIVLGSMANLEDTAFLVHNLFVQAIQ